MAHHADGLNVNSGYSDFEYRARPQRRGSRPRTKDKPSYDDSVEGLVVTVDRGRYSVVVSPADGPERMLTCVRAARLRRFGIVPGDKVSVVGDVSGESGSLARLVEVSERTTLLRRSADDENTAERLLVANADQIVIVTAAADPEPSPRLIDRALAAAFDAGMKAIIAVTKTDLAPLDSLAERYEVVDVPVIGTNPDSNGIPDPATLLPYLDGRTSVLVGHSGVGKSTLMNELVPNADRATGHVNDVTGRGRHTSSSAQLLPLEPPAQGWIIDTPGIRSFGLAHVTAENILAAFDDLVPATSDCPRGCLHTAESPGCALDPWVAAGKAGERGAVRLDSFRRLLASKG